MVSEIIALFSQVSAKLYLPLTNSLGSLNPRQANGRYGCPSAAFVMLCFLMSVRSSTRVALRDISVVCVTDWTIVWLGSCGAIPPAA